MFVVSQVLISDDIADAPFSCNLEACEGACCVRGESGAPLEEEETEILESVVPIVWSDLSDPAREVIADSGCWECLPDGRFATKCVGRGQCVFVTFSGRVAKCAVQKAFLEGKTSFLKPISCHLFPVRIDHYGSYEVMNYEQVAICDSARRSGRKLGQMLPTFLREALVRRYGEEWFEDFLAACDERREVLGRQTAT